MNQLRSLGIAGTGQAVSQVVNVHVSGHSRGQKRWNAGVAMLLSFLIPGLGQMYKGQVINGLAWLVAVIVGYVFFIIPGLILHLCCIVGAGMGDPYER